MFKNRLRKAAGNNQISKAFVYYLSASLLLLNSNAFCFRGGTGTLPKLSALHCKKNLVGIASITSPAKSTNVDESSPEKKMLKHEKDGSAVYPRDIIGTKHESVPPTKVVKIIRY